MFATASLLDSFANLELFVSPIIAAGNITAVEEALLLSPEALKVQIVLANMQLDWPANVANIITYANGNLSQFGDYLTGEIYGSLSQLFTIYHFDPTVCEPILKFQDCFWLISIYVTSGRVVSSAQRGAERSK